jgi:hypothetical protein
MLLCEMYSKENKLKHALFLMAIGKQKIKEKQYVIGSRVYERLRIEYSKMLTGVSQAEETKLKKSKKMKEVWSSKSEEEMTAIGKKRAINRKKNNSEWHTKEWRKKISNSLKGRDTTPANKSRSKSILQFDLQNHFIQEWPSIAEAERQVGGDIKSAIAGRQKTAAGFIWKPKS